MLPYLFVIATRKQVKPRAGDAALPHTPLSDLHPFWRRVRACAGVKDVRIHDLRQAREHRWRGHLCDRLVSEGINRHTQQPFGLDLRGL